MSQPAASPVDAHLSLNLALVGGRLEPDNGAVFNALGDKSGGRIAVFATASLIPHEVGPDTVADLRSYGIDAELMPLTWDNHERAAFDPKLAGRMSDFGGVYFTGGNQTNLLHALRQDGDDTPVLRAIRELGARGGLIAGSSAGTAVMSRLSILGGTSLEAIVYGITEHEQAPGMMLGPGFGFFPFGLLDQHFLQRGRIGRLLVALAATRDRFGFGVDENTALLVEGGTGHVVGEKGVIVLDASDAIYDIEHRHYDRFRVSYLDDGDRFDFGSSTAHPQPTRKPIRKSRAFHGPGFVQRSVFAPYVFEELLTRLAEGDPVRYACDHANAYEPDAEIEVALEIQRSPLPGHSLAAKRGPGKRYTVLNYGLDVNSRPLGGRAHREYMARHTKQLMRGAVVAAGAQLVGIGAALTTHNTSLLADLRALDREVTVIAAAASGARQVAKDYVKMLRGAGLEARIFDNRHESALQELAEAPAVLFTGGNQERLLLALFQQGEESPLLLAVIAAYLRGGTLMAVGGAANTLSPTMISGGNAEEAMLFGASPDPGYRGVVLQEGLGLLRDGLIDQHFVQRNRLARLLVGCIEEGMRWGFGLAEDSGMLTVGGSHQLRALGPSGFACLDLHSAMVHAHTHGFVARGVQLRWVGRGQIIDTASGELRGPTPPATPLAEVVQRFAREANALDGRHQTMCRVTDVQIEAGMARFDIEIQRNPEGRRSIPELDGKTQPKRGEEGWRMKDEG